MKLTINDIFEVETAEIFNPDEFKPVSKVIIDSRKVKKKSMFVAIKGNRFDGHDFVREAVKNGAGAVVINRRKLSEFEDLEIPVVAVKNTLKAYGNIALLWRRKLKGNVVSITGSNGKTTTKEILSVLLAERYRVTKTESNNNNQIGVPLTILSANEKTEVLVLEHGTNHFGEIEYTARIAEPDYSIITNIGDSHIKYLKNRNGVYKEKSALLKITDALGGIVFINNDDPVLLKNKNKFKNAVTYGFDNSSDVKGTVTDFTKEGKPEINIEGFGKSISVILPLLGSSNAQNYLSAVAIALKLGLKKSEILNGTKKIKPVKGRLNLIQRKGFAVIDDTYNSNPQSVKEALDVLKKMKVYKNRVIILGDMLELGEKSVELHKKLKSQIKNAKPLIVLTLGKYMKYLAEELTNTKINSVHFKTRKSLRKFLEKFDLNNTVILVKGSRGMRMEEFVEQILGKVN